MENFMGSQKKFRAWTAHKNFNFLGSLKLIWAVYKVNELAK
jgi:hypothetical protein